MDLPEGTTARNPEDYLVKLRDAQLILVQATQDYLKKNQRKRGVDGGRRDVEITIQWEITHPNKLAGMYPGPMVITVIDRPDLVKVKDLITNRKSLVQAS